MHLQFNSSSGRIQKLDPEHIGLISEDILEVISKFDAIGIWRVDLDTGLVYWSDAVFEILGFDIKKGAVDVGAAVDAYHPDDREIVLKCMEETAKNKRGYRYVLRLKQPSGEYIWVKSCGIYRKLENGSEEIFGYIEKLPSEARSVTILNQN